MTLQFIALIVGASWISVLIALQWAHARWAHVDFRIRYVLGMGIVCGGCLFAGALLSDPLLAVVPGLLATAGAGILKSYADEDKAARDQANAQKRGEVVGMARGLHQALSQEMIDRGDDPTRN